MPIERTRRAVTLAELLIVVTIAAVAATLALGAWVQSEEAGALRRAQMQVAGILRDAITRAETPCAGLDPTGRCGAGGPLVNNQAEVCFTAGSGTLTESASYGSGWQAVTPFQSLTLPRGITVRAGSVTFTTGTGCMLVTTGHIGATQSGLGPSPPGTPVWTGITGQTSPGSVTLVSPHGVTATVTVGASGSIWF